MSVNFTSAAALVNELMEAKIERRLLRVESKRCRRPTPVHLDGLKFQGMRPVWPRLIYFAVKFQGMRSSMRLVLWSCRRSSTQVSHASGLTPFMWAVSIKV